MTTSHIPALLAAVAQLGSRAALARALHVTPVAVGQWLNPGDSSRRVPPKQCVRIEALTDGAVTRRALRPDDWQEFWPELAYIEPKQATTLTSKAQAATETVAQGVA